MHTQLQRLTWSYPLSSNASCCLSSYFPNISWSINMTRFQASSLRLETNSTRSFCNLQHQTIWWVRLLEAGKLKVKSGTRCGWWRAGIKCDILAFIMNDISAKVNSSRKTTHQFSTSAQGEIGMLQIEISKKRKDR